MFCTLLTSIVLLFLPFADFLLIGEKPNPDKVKGLTSKPAWKSIRAITFMQLWAVLLGKEILSANEAQSGKETTQAKPARESAASIPLHMRKSPPEELAAKAAIPASVLGVEASASCSSATNEDSQPNSVVIPEPLGNDGTKIFKDLTFVLFGSFPMVVGGGGEGDLVGVEKVKHVIEVSAGTS